MTEEKQPVPKGKQQSVGQSKGRWGLRDKTFWDWLQLIVVPLALAATVFYLQDQADRRQERIADERAMQETLNKYFDEMTDLLFEQKLRAAKLRGEARTVARARTLTALRELDGGRKGQLLSFMQKAELISGDKSVIDLRDANLSYADLSGVSIWIGGSLNLRGANLRNADPRNANLSNTILSNDNLTGAKFCKTKMPDKTENNQDCL